MKARAWTKQEYIKFVVDNHNQTEAEAIETVERIMRAHGYVTNKEGVICTFSISR